VGNLALVTRTEQYTMKGGKAMPDESEVLEGEVEEVKAVTVAEASAVNLVGDADGLVARYETIKDAADRVLREGVDFGAIPGTDKPTLLKPGAEKLATLFHLHPRFELLGKLEDWDKGRFFYRYSCKLFARDGTFVGEGVGSCNSLEERYRWRQAKPVCPECGQETIFRSKYPPKDAPNMPPGWYCWKKRGGCGQVFAYNDPGITEQDVGRVENPEPFGLVNTIDKMAQKRALVAAVLITTGASEFFTQDIEDSLPQTQEAAEVPTGKISRPLDPETLLSFLERRAASKAPGMQGRDASPKQASVVAQLWEECFAGDAASKDKYHDSLIGAFDVESATKLTMAQASALIDWLKGWEGEPIPDTGPTVHQHAVTEAQTLYRWLLKEEGQQEMLDD
jgi:hypothetical protein